MLLQERPENADAGSREIGGEDAVFTCHRCRVPTLHLRSFKSTSHTEGHASTAEDGREYWEKIGFTHLIYECVKCRRQTYFLVRDAVRYPTNEENPEATSEPTTIVHRFPVATPVIHESVPRPVTDAAIEAEKSLAISAPNASMAIK